MSRLRTEESGSALIELALLLPVLTAFFLGGVGLSFAITEAMTVSQAAEVGAMYGTVPANQNNPSTLLSGMQTAAQQAAGNLSGFQATASTFCSCSAGGAAVSCSSSCPSGTQYAYVKVVTSATVPMLVSVPGLNSAATLNGLSILRVH